MLGGPEEVFHLRLNELETVDDPANLTESEKDELRDVVRTRSARREELTGGARLIDPAAVFPRRETGDALITGTPASSGSATGPVTVIREPAEFGRLTSGDVLVCRLHKPRLDDVVPTRGGSGRRPGGPASHAAIVAREYGIPAVMGTGTGTTTLTDGQLVNVDGTTGRVTAAVPRHAGGSD